MRLWPLKLRFKKACSGSAKAAASKSCQEKTKEMDAAKNFEEDLTLQKACSILLYPIRIKEKMAAQHREVF